MKRKICIFAFIKFYLRRRYLDIQKNYIKAKDRNRNKAILINPHFILPLFKIAHFWVIIKMTGGKLNLNQNGKYWNKCDKKQNNSKIHQQRYMKVEAR